MKENRFINRWALVTGASSGIGREIAIELARKQANLVLVSRTESVLEALQQQLQEQFQVRVLFIPIDLSKPNTAGEIQKFCDDQGISITIVVNNAGYALKTADEIKKPEQVCGMLEVLVCNLTELSLRFLPGMMLKGEGYILNISSIVAYIPVASTLTYHAAKAYVLAFTKALHWEYAKKGIHITCSLPGATKTGFSKASDLYVPEQLWKTYGSAESVAKVSIEAMAKNQCVVIPGWNNRLLYWLSRILPHYWIYTCQKKYWSHYRPS
ncbi:MAG: SDR family NAD(P)-dependent oxidoreductase [Caldisericia bacterium]|nr:SDR family NAD(P)-dependent oxidoreductase [Caldisericia bacterium]